MVSQALALLRCHAPVAVAELLATIPVHFAVALVIFPNSVLLFGRQITKHLRALANGCAALVIELAPRLEAALAFSRCSGVMLAQRSAPSASLAWRSGGRLSQDSANWPSISCCPALSESQLTP